MSDRRFPPAWSYPYPVILFGLPLANGMPILVRGDATWLAVGTAKNSFRPFRTCLSDLGSDGRIFDDSEVVQLLKAAIDQEGNQMALTLSSETVDDDAPPSRPPWSVEATRLFIISLLSRA